MASDVMLPSARRHAARNSSVESAWGANASQGGHRVGDLGDGVGFQRLAERAGGAAVPPRVGARGAVVAEDGAQRAQVEVLERRGAVVAALDLDLALDDPEGREVDARHARGGHLEVGVGTARCAVRRDDRAQLGRVDEALVGPAGAGAGDVAEYDRAAAVRHLGEREALGGLRGCAPHDRARA